MKLVFLQKEVNHVPRPDAVFFSFTDDLFTHSLNRDGAVDLENQRALNALFGVLGRTNDLNVELALGLAEVHMNLQGVF